MATDQEIKAAEQDTVEIIDGIRYQKADAEKVRKAKAAEGDQAEETKPVTSGDVKARPTTANKARTADGDK